MRNRSFRNAKRRHLSVVRAADVLTPAPGQGEGWGGGRNSACAVPTFDPHPSLPPARGKEHVPLAAALTPCRAAIRFSANNGRRQAFGRLSKNKSFCIVKFAGQISRLTASGWRREGSGGRKSGDPFDEALAFSERAAPPSPKRGLQHGSGPVRCAALSKPQHPTSRVGSASVVPPRTTGTCKGLGLHPKRRCD